MGTSMSMDVSASVSNVNGGIICDASLSPLLLPMLTPPPTLHAPKSFDDNWRTESVLIPEDMTDIHIEASAVNTSGDTNVGNDDTNGPDETATADTPADNTRYGRGKNQKRNIKKKQHARARAQVSGSSIIPIQTERTMEQRREQVRPIIDKLTELQMNISYPAIRELYKQLNQFVKTGDDAKIKIAFPEFSRKIKGELTNATHKSCWVKLEME
ncbi:MAG: hypothetical protein EBU66_16305 [Bacteroidetes bacterium]|nr:hypothetical protein [Bacteroidota bacterium]